MKTKKKFGFWLYPIIQAFLLSMLGLLGAAILVWLIFYPLTVLGVDLSSFGALPILANDISRIILAVVIIVILKRKSNGLFYFGFSKINFKESMILSSMTLILGLANVMEAVLFDGVFQEPGLMLVISFSSSLAAGFYEEVACRGFVITNMMRKWKESPNYILCSTLAGGAVFGLIHLLNLTHSDVFSTLCQVFYAGGLGIFLCAVYIRTRNLWGPFLFHFLLDATAFVFIVQNPNELYTNVVSISIIIVMPSLGLYLIRPSMRPKIEEVWAGAVPKAS